jgi:hypothetical protein
LFVWLTTIFYEDYFVFCYINYRNLILPFPISVMKMNVRKLTVIVLWVIGFAAVPLQGFAQGGPGDNPGIPIDGGVAWLAAAGIAYGLKRARDYRQQAKSNLRK